MIALFCAWVAVVWLTWLVARAGEPGRKPVKRFVKIAAVVFMGIVLWICWAWHREGVLERKFERVERGDSQARVIELFGQPSFTTLELQTNIDWNQTWSTRYGVKCVRQFHFCPPLSICGEEWVVGFDDQSNAVAKYHIVSP